LKLKFKSWAFVWLLKETERDFHSVSVESRKERVTVFGKRKSVSVESRKEVVRAMFSGLAC
jgi:hypothetical protein